MITETRRDADSAAQVTRCRVFGRAGDAGNSPCFDLTVERDRVGAGWDREGFRLVRSTGTFTVRWNCNRGRGWMKGWKHTAKSEAEAMAFAATKLEALRAWAEKQGSKVAS